MQLGSQPLLESTFNSSYWTGYSIPPMLPSYDPYLTSGHYDYPAADPVYHYYPPDQEPAPDVLDTDTMAASATTEDITFAEAFTALANYDPPHPDHEEGHRYDPQHPDHEDGQPEQREQEKPQYSNQHIETFNEISLGKVWHATLFDCYFSCPGSYVYNSGGIHYDLSVNGGQGLESSE